MGDGFNKEKESEIAKSSASTQSHELSEQPQQHVHKQQRQLPSETQQILIEPNGEDQGVVGRRGASVESDWVISIKQKLNCAREDGDKRLWSKLSIYKIPHYLREGDEEAYAPQIVSLGPYHHGKKRLRQMDRHKWRSLQHVLKRTNQDINLYLDSIKELEGKARDCYEGPINLSSNKFVEMMVLDGCFMLELFRVADEGLEQLGYDKDDPVFAMCGSIHLIQRDMIMLENQIPLFILDRLLVLQLGYPDQRGHVAALAAMFFDTLMPAEEPLKKIDQNKLESSLHCLDAFRRRLLRPWEKPATRISGHENHPVDGQRGLQVIHCATELRDAGINFKKGETHQFWDVKFEKGNLEIPRLLIDDGTKSLFLNLIAFEQCHLDCTNDICSYVLFIDHLINSSEDVRHLHYRGIIEHWLGSDDKVAHLFNRLCQEVVFDINDSYFSKLSEDINKYYNQRWHAWRAVLKQKYFNNPWAIISVIAGVVLLALAFAQTFYGVFGYHRPN